MDIGINTEALNKLLKRIKKKDFNHFVNSTKVSMYLIFVFFNPILQVMGWQV